MREEQQNDFTKAEITNEQGYEEMKETKQNETGLKPVSGILIHEEDVEAI